MLLASCFGQLLTARVLLSLWQFECCLFDFVLFASSVVLHALTVSDCCSFVAMTQGHSFIQFCSSRRWGIWSPSHAVRAKISSDHSLFGLLHFIINSIKIKPNQRSQVLGSTLLRDNRVYGARLNSIRYSYHL